MGKRGRPPGRPRGGTGAAGKRETGKARAEKPAGEAQATDCPDGAPVVERADPLTAAPKRGPGRPPGAKNRSHKKIPGPPTDAELGEIENGLAGMLQSFIGVRKGDPPTRAEGILYAGEAKVISYAGARVIAKRAGAGFVGEYMHEMLLGATLLAVLVREVVAAFKEPADATTGDTASVGESASRGGVAATSARH